jgi:hypothetical protein
MTWTIHYQNDNRALKVLADTIDRALETACTLLQFGAAVEKIESDTGMVIDGQNVALMCQARRGR